MKLVRTIAMFALIASAVTLSACASGGGSCCGACAQGAPCQCK